MGNPPRRVLLVDDDEAILESVRCALLERGYQVVVARDGAEALACAERDAPDLILLDVVMPKRSGLTVLDRLRSRQSGAPPVIMMTANEAQKQRDFATSRGVAAFISKPFEMEHLLAAVDAALQA
ncbi:MAG: response regulator [Planctomycetaceae bacterium]